MKSLMNNRSYKVFFLVSKDNIIQSVNISREKVKIYAGNVAVFKLYFVYFKKRSVYKYATM